MTCIHFYAEKNEFVVYKFLYLLYFIIGRPEPNVFNLDYFLISYQELMKDSSRMPLFDLRKLNASLPVPSVPKSSIEILVVGAMDDFIVVRPYCLMQNVLLPHQIYADTIYICFRHLLICYAIPLWQLFFTAHKCILCFMK